MWTSLIKWVAASMGLSVSLHPQAFVTLELLASLA